MKTLENMYPMHFIYFDKGWNTLNYDPENLGFAEVMSIRDAEKRCLSESLKSEFPISCGINRDLGF